MEREKKEMRYKEETGEGEESKRGSEGEKKVQDQSGQKETKQKLEGQEKKMEEMYKTSSIRQVHEKLEKGLMVKTRHGSNKVEIIDNQIDET